MIDIERDDLSRPSVRALVAEHLADMHDTSPPESVHALGLDALREPAVTVWTAWGDGQLLGCGALKELAVDAGEIKSMRTAASARGRGVGAAVLTFLLDEAHRRGYRRVSLETGTQDYFAAARRLYERHGFTSCPPFGDYLPDPNSAFFTRSL